MKMMNIANILTTFFEAAVILMLISTYVEKERKKSLLTYVISALVLVCITNLSNKVFYNGYLNIVILLATVFVIGFVFTKNIKSSALIAVILALIFITTELVTMFLLSYLMRVSAAEATDVESYRIMGMIFSKLFAFVVVKVVCVKHSANRTTSLKSSYWVLFFLIFAISTLAIYLLYMLQYFSMAPAIYNYLSVWCSLGLLYNMFFSLYLYEKIIKHADIERKQELFRQQIKSQAKHVDEILVTQKEMKKLRHDLKNHAVSLQGYFESKDFKGGLEYLQNMRGKTALSKDSIETGNITLDAILNTKRSIAISKGIIFRAQLQIPENLFIDPIDICIIFGNALDNAIEACEQVENREKRIYIAMTYAQDALVCKIVNSAKKVNTRFLKSVKTDKESHGFGVENIEAALSNYKNVHRFSQIDEEFTFFFQIFEN